MSYRKSSSRLFTLSCVVAMTACSLGRDAFAAELCSGQSSTTVTSAIPGTTCTLDVDNAVLDVTVQGGIDDGVQTAVENVVVHNAGLISGNATAIRFTTFGAAAVFGNTGGLQAGGADNTAAFHVEGNVLGIVDNDGTITAIASGAVAYAAGVVLDAGIAAGILDNAGIVSAQAQSAGQASAYAISSGSLDAGTLTNAGVADAQASAQSGEALAFGITTYVLGNGSTVENSGRITVLAEGSVNAAAESSGISIDNLTQTLVENSGEITTIARAAGTNRTALARGIVNGSFFVSTDSITANRGVLTVSASSADYVANAWGIQMTSSMRTGTAVTNQGELQVDAEAGAVLAQVYGIWTPWLTAGARIDSSGSISAAARASGSARAYGIRAEALGDGSIASSGTITVSAFSRSGEAAQAVGIISELGLGGSATITNDGLVQVSAVSNGTSPAATAESADIQVALVDIPALIANTGSLIAQSAAGSGTATAFGISVDTLNGTVRNDGLISAQSATPGSAYAIYAQSGTGQVINNGTLTGRVHLGGTVALDNAGSLDLQEQLSDIGGNYTQTGGRLDVAVRDLATHGRLDVGGIADLSGAARLRIAIDPAQRLYDGDLLPVISAGTLLAPGAGLAIDDNSLFWRFTATSAGGMLNLRADAVATASVLAADGLTTTPSLAALVDNLVANGGASRYPELVAALTTAEAPRDVADLVAQLQPALGTAAAQATRIAGNVGRASIGARFAELRGAAAGDAAAVANNVWLKPFLGRAEQADVRGVSGYALDTSGVALGMDSEIGDVLRLGAALASAQSDVGSSGAGLDIDGLQFMLYGSRALDSQSTLEFDLGYGRNDYASQRRLDFLGSTAQAEFGGDQYGIGVALNRRYALGQTVTLTPALELRYSRVRVDGYVESSAGNYDLAVAEHDSEAVQLSFRGGYEQVLPLGTLLAGAGIGYDSANAAGASATLAGGSPAFTSPGIDPATFALTGHLGYRYATSGGLEISALYEREAREGFRGQTALLKFRLPF